MVVGGTALTVAGSATHGHQKHQRESVQGLMGPAGHKRVPAQPFIEIEVYSGQSVDHEALASIEAEVAQIDYYDGTSFVLYNCAQVGTIEPDDAEGTFTLRLEGPDGKRIGVTS